MARLVVLVVCCWLLFLQVAANAPSERAYQGPPPDGPQHPQKTGPPPPPPGYPQPGPREQIPHHDRQPQQSPSASGGPPANPASSADHDSYSYMLAKSSDGPVTVGGGTDLIGHLLNLILDLLTKVFQTSLDLTDLAKGKNAAEEISTRAFLTFLDIAEMSKEFQFIFFRLFSEVNFDILLDHWFHLMEVFRTLPFHGPHRGHAPYY